MSKPAETAPAARVADLLPAARDRLQAIGLARQYGRYGDRKIVDAMRLGAEKS